MSAESRHAKRQREAPIVHEDLLVHARLMWQKDPSHPRSTGSEDRDFREYFGCSILVALVIWKMICDLQFQPAGGNHYHLLWALCYLKQYPKTRAMSSICNRADPTTWRKWVWLFIPAIAALEDYVVSTSSGWVCFLVHPHH